jgi:hypothetical protein
MVIVRLAGGAGNQLFQLNAAYSCVDNLPCIDCHVLYTTSGLSAYAVPRSLFGLISSLEYAQHAGGILNKLIETRVAKIFGVSSSKICLINDRNASVRMSDSECNPLVVLDGYFQGKNSMLSQRFLSEIRGSVERKKFNGELYNSNMLTIHIRGGDIVTRLSVSNISDYYKNAIQYVKENTGFSKVCCVTDDLILARQILSGLFDVNDLVISTGSIEDDFITLVKSKLLITAPSSFSWWAGVIGYRDFLSPGYFVDQIDKIEAPNEVIVKS